MQKTVVSSPLLCKGFSSALRRLKMLFCRGGAKRGAHYRPGGFLIGAIPCSSVRHQRRLIGTLAMGYLAIRRIVIEAGVIKSHEIQYVDFAIIGEEENGRYTK